MSDAALEQQLAQLGLDRENWRAVSLLPLIEVAWADGRIQDAERKLLVEISARFGIHPGQGFLERWLSKRPPKTDFLRARTLLIQLWRRASPGDVPQPETLEQLLDLCLRVAEAAGGLFGLLFTVEASERDCMSEIAASLSLGPALPEPVAAAWRPAAASPRSLASEQPTTLLQLPKAPKRAKKAPPPPVGLEETTKIQAPGRSVARKGRGMAPPNGVDLEATTTRLARVKPPAPPEPFDEEITSPYVDVQGALDAGAESLYDED